MLNRTHVAHRSLALLLGPALLYVLGCSGDDGLGTRYPVSGKVTYKGEPVAKGRISFVPKEKGGHAATGTIENGTFPSLTSLTAGDGALPGDYKVGIDTHEIDEAAAKEEGEKLAKKHGMSNLAQLPPEVQAQALRKAKSSIPVKYSNPDKSDLPAKVEAKSNSFVFELKD